MFLTSLLNEQCSINHAWCRFSYSVNNVNVICGGEKKKGDGAQAVQRFVLRWGCLIWELIPFLHSQIYISNTRIETNFVIKKILLPSDCSFLPKLTREKVWPSLSSRPMPSLDLASYWCTPKHLIIWLGPFRYLLGWHFHFLLYIQK